MANPTGIDTVEIRDTGGTYSDLGRILPDETEGLDPEMLEDTDDSKGTPLHAGQAMEPTIGFDPATSSVTPSSLTTDAESDTQKDIRITYLSGKTLEITGYIFSPMPINAAGVGEAEGFAFSIREVKATGGFIPS